MCRNRTEPDSADKPDRLISREQEIAALAAGASLLGAGAAPAGMRPVTVLLLLDCVVGTASDETAQRFAQPAGGGRSPMMQELKQFSELWSDPVFRPSAGLAGTVPGQLAVPASEAAHIGP